MSSSGRLLLALMSVGWMLAPAALAADSGLRFTDVTAEAGFDHVNVNGDPDHKAYIFEAKGGGAGALDFDGDGWMDLAVGHLTDGNVTILYNAAPEPTALCLLALAGPLLAPRRRRHPAQPTAPLPAIRR